MNQQWKYKLVVFSWPCSHATPYVPLCASVTCDDGVQRVRKAPTTCFEAAEAGVPNPLVLIAGLDGHGREADHFGAGPQARAHEAVRHMGSGQNTVQLYSKVGYRPSLVPGRPRQLRPGCWLPCNNRRLNHGGSSFLSLLSTSASHRPVLPLSWRF